MAAVNFLMEQRRDRFFLPPKFTKSLAEVTEKGSAFLNTWESKINANQLMRNRLTNQNLFTEEHDEYNQFFHDWNRQNKNWFTDKINKDGISVLRNLAVEGILTAGERLAKLSQAKQMADELKNAQSSLEQVCIKLYTKETFLYHELNTVLRDNDFSQLSSLGPYAYMLYKSLINSNCMSHNITVYRGTYLTPEMIEEYKSSVGQIAKWLGFSSTSRNRQLGEIYSGNTLFIIDIKQPVALDGGYDISSLSQFPGEEEILLLAGGRFKIENVQFNSENDKYFIYLTIF